MILTWGSIALNHKCSVKIDGYAHGIMIRLKGQTILLVNAYILSDDVPAAMRTMSNIKHFLTGVKPPGSYVPIGTEPQRK